MKLSKNQLIFLQKILQEKFKNGCETKSETCILLNLINQVNNELESYNKKYINELIEIKNKNKLTYDELEKITDLSKNTLQNIIKGNYTDLKRATIKKLKLFLLEYERGHINLCQK